MYDTIYSDVVMEDLKEFYPDASDELLDELASDLYFDNRRLLMNTFADTISYADPQRHQPLHIAHRANRAER